MDRVWMGDVSYWYSNCQPEDREYVNQVLEFCKKYEPDGHFELARHVSKNFYNFSSVEFSQFSMKVITKIFGETCANKLWNFMGNCENVFLFDVWYTIFKERSPDHVDLNIRMKFEVTPENLHILYVNNIWGQYDLGRFYPIVLDKILEQKNYLLFLEMFLLLDKVVICTPASLEFGTVKFDGKVGYYKHLPVKDRKNVYNTIINTPEYHDVFGLYDVKRTYHNTYDNYHERFVLHEERTYRDIDETLIQQINPTEHTHFLCTPNFTFE